MAFFQRWSMTSYRPLSAQSSSESEEDLLYEQEKRTEVTGRSTLQGRQQRIPRPIVFFTIINIIIFGATLFLAFPALKQWPSRESHEDSSYYSPVLEDISMPYRDDKINGTLFPTANPPFSRLMTGPEAHKAWSWIEVPTFLFPLTRDQVLRLGKDPEIVSKFPDDIYGLGDEAYIGGLDTLHKLHCMNEIRMAAFENAPPHSDGVHHDGNDYETDIEHDNDTEAEPHHHYARQNRRRSGKRKHHKPLYWIHLGHCIDVIAQDLMCHADPDIMTFNWLDGQRHPFPDFNINRKCRDWNQLMAWKEKHALQWDDFWQGMKRPDDVKPIRAEDGYYELYGFENSEVFPNGKGYERQGGNYVGNF